MKTYNDLSVHEKIHIKQIAINLHGKRWHVATPDFLNKLNELHICYLLSC